MFHSDFPDDFQAQWSYQLLGKNSFGSSFYLVWCSMTEGLIYLLLFTFYYLTRDTWDKRTIASS